MSSLLDLPSDALRSILRFLQQPKDLVSVQATCTRLQAVASQDELWEQHCSAWVARQPAGAGLGRVAPSDLRHALGVASNKQLYEALHKLGAWPAGTWYCCTEDEWSHPRGQLLVVDQEGGSFTASLVQPCIVPGPPIDQAAIWEYDEWFHVQAGAGAGSGGVGTKAGVSLRWFFPGDAANCLAVAVDGEELVVYSGRKAEELQVPQASRLLLGSLVEPPAPELYVVPFSRLLPGRQQAPLASPQPAGHSVAGAGGRASTDAASLLQRLEGLYTGCYGPHGMEVLQLRMAGPTEEPPPGCSITGLRLQARKITGDPNVPALKYSFVVDASQCRLGPYAPQADDPFPQGGFARPVLSFYQAATLVLHLEDRPVVARFRAVGQINQTPGVWDPEFVPATLVVYEQGYRLPFTVIFEDEGIQVRHAMDFHACCIPMQAGFDRGDSGGSTGIH